MISALQTESTIVNITGLTHDGRGIATINGKAAFITGALPGESVTYRITKKHSRYIEGEAVEIIQASPERTHPLCPHFQICGGCSLQHIQAEKQIQFKQQVLLDQLNHFGKVKAEEIIPPLSHQAWNYRRKARLGVRYVTKKERVLVGFREKHSRYLAELTTCPVLHESVGTRIPAFCELIETLSQKDQIPQIEIAVSDTATALVFRHLAPLTDKDIIKLQQFAEHYQFHIYLQANSPNNLKKIYPLSDESHRLTYSLSEFELEMKFHPLDFIQVNGQVNQLLIKRAIEWLDPKSDDTILDLFCGLGNFTLPIARFAKHVIGIEGSVEMVERANENALHNQISNAEFYSANLMEPVANASWLKKQYTKILLDPPRAGAKEIIPFLSRCQAKKIVYISCNPATLARDAGELAYNLGYTLKRIGVVNMFPHTSHIEAIALFEKE